MLGEAAILDPDHISSDPCGGAALASEAATENHIVPLRHDNTGLIAESVRRASDEVEQSLAAGRDMVTVLDVSIRPEARRSFVIALVEERTERLQNQCLVLFRNGIAMSISISMGSLRALNRRRPSRCRR